MRFDNLLDTLRFTLRTLRRNASFTMFVVLLAGLGIGASSAVFTIVNTLLLRPLPFDDPDRLVWITNFNRSGLSAQTTQVGHMLDLRERTRTLSAVAGYFAFYGVGDSLMSGTAEPERLSAVPVSINFFDVLGVRPQHGRFFSADEGAWNGPRTVVLGDGFWRRRFAGDPAVVGSAVTINDQPHTIVGVLPASFDFGSVFAPGSQFDLFLAFPLTPETNRYGNTMAMVGRLRPGASVAEAHAEIRTIAEQLNRERTDRNRFEGNVTALADKVRQPVRLAVWVLAGSVAMVMLIVCANLSNLLLSRATSRQKEFAIRSALGASRSRLVGQMLTESIVLSVCGTIVGLALAVAGTRALTGLEGVSIPLLRDVRVDGTAIVFTAGVAIAAGLLFGLAPAFFARSGVLHETLKDATRGSTEGRGRQLMRNALVVSEIAFASVLLVAAGLLIRSLIRVLDVDLGFEPARAAAIRVDPDSRYATPEQQVAYIDEVLGRVKALPGVEAAGITDVLPLGRNRTWGVRAKGVTYERGRGPIAFIRVVSDGYPGAMGIRLAAGRDLAPSDTARTEPVVMINETMARALWPGQDPIGKYVLNACAPERRVVGVIADVRHLALEEASGNEMYIPMRQCDDRPTYDLIVRSSLPPAPLAGAIREALRPIAPNLPGNEFRTLQQMVDKSVSPRRFTVWLLGAFAAFALVLASLGIYALISYSVSQRTQEIGIRMALGATTGNVKRQIVGQTLRLTAIGLVIGAAASWALARSLGGLLFEVTPGDPRTFLAMVVVLTVVATIAGYLPARRASAIDPMIALRAE
jgi:predicted permease